MKCPRPLTAVPGLKSRPGTAQAKGLGTHDTHTLGIPERATLTHRTGLILAGPCRADSPPIHSHPGRPPRALAWRAFGPSRPLPRLLATPAFLLADGDWIQVLAALIFFLVTGVAQWLQKRSRERQGLPPEGTIGEPWVPPSTRTGDRPQAEPNLEEQLRRLLNPGMPPEPPPLPPPLPSSTSSYRRYDPELEPESVSWEDAEAPSRPLSSFESADAAYQRGADLESTTSARLTTSSSLASAAAAVENASRLSEHIRTRLRGASDATASPAPSTARLLGSATSAEARSLAAVLRNPVTARQALLASIVLQPPKALENTT